VTDARGFVSESQYDKMDRLVKSIAPDPDGTGPLLAPFSTYEYDLNGNLVKTIDPLGRETRSSYDARNRLMSTTLPDLSVQQTGYDLDNNPIRSTDANQQSSQSALDARGRRIAEMDALGNRTRFVYDPANQLVAQIDAKGQVTRYAYDAVGRRVLVTDAQGNVTRTEYDKNGNVIASIDPLGNRTEVKFDLRDRQVKVFDANNFVNGTPIANPKATVTAYDAVGNVLSVTDPLGNKTSYVYDRLNRLTTETNQLNQSRLFAYDENGNRVRVSDRNNQVRTFEFDGLNRQTRERWIGVSNSVLRDITSSYDAAGQLTRLSDLDATYTFGYDLMGRLKSVDNAGSPGVTPVLLTYGYDRNGNLNSVAEMINGQAGATTTYTFDALDRVSMVMQSGAGVQAKRVDFAYNKLGQVESINRFSDLSGIQKVAGTTYQYNALSQLQQLSHKQANQGVISTYTFGYDAAERMTRIQSQFANASFNDETTYTYDKTSQLQGADHSATADESYSYDANGNRTTAGYSTGTDNRLQSDGVYTYTYDHEGNLIQRVGNGTTRTFTWDYRNRLTSVTDGGVTATYTYDAMNRRISKSVGGTTTRFVYDRDNVLLEFTGSAVPSVRYLHGTMVDQVLAQEKVGQESSGQTSWMLTDQLGSVRDLVSNAGTVVGHFTYDSFGQVVSATGTVDSRYKFTGRELDGETELYYYRARYYDARVGRFIGQDPIGFGAGDSNLYRYVGNSSLNATDPSGEKGVVSGFRRTITYVDRQGREKIVFHIDDVIRARTARSFSYVKTDYTTATIWGTDTTGSGSHVDPNVRPLVPDLRTGLDDAGHIIGRQLGGSGMTQNNLFAQEKSHNRGWAGTYQLWRAYENTIEKAVNTQIGSGSCECYPKAEMTVKLWYEKPLSSGAPRPLSLRPIKITSFTEFKGAATFGGRILGWIPLGSIHSEVPNPK
jgi:RHS repeat-associated protein